MKKTQDDEMKRDGLPVDEDPSMENRYSDEYDRDEDLDMEEEVLSEYAGMFRKRSPLPGNRKRKNPFSPDCLPTKTKIPSRSRP